MNVLDILYYTLTWCAMVMLWTKIVQDKFEYEKNIVIYMKIIMIVIMTLTIDSFRKSNFGDFFIS